LAYRLLDAAEPLHLFDFQSQARHFEVLGADAIEQSLMELMGLMGRCAQQTPPGNSR
jgi:hypothetical protein